MGKFIPNENTVILFSTTGPGGLEVPTNVAASTATTGGHLAAGTNAYRVVALNGVGGSLPSAQVSQVVPSGTTTNLNTVTWSAVDGETAGYDIYGRTSGTELKIGHVATGVLTFADDGSATPAGRLPTKDTSIDISSPSLSRDIETAIDLTDPCTGLNASSQGNSVPTPSLKRLFTTSILGTSQATFTADFYRDDEPDDDVAWDTLVRGTKGWFFIRRFGQMPVVGDEVEVWPVTLLSSAMANMADNTVVSFTLTCAVPDEPDEHAVVVE